MRRNASLDIPPDLDPAAPGFIQVLNDRLRRLGQNATGNSVSTVTILSGSGSMLGGGYNVLSIVSGAITPDLSRGANQEAPLTSDITVNAAINGVDGATWTLILDQDLTGGWLATFDGAAYYGDMSGLLVTPNTRSQLTWVMRSGKNSLSSIVTGQPIPA